MGSWRITMRESDYGLDLLGTIIDRQLKALNFSTFKVADALEVIKADIMEEIRLANRCQRQLEIVNFRRNKMSFFGGRHSSLYSPFQQPHLPT